MVGEDDSAALSAEEMNAFAAMAAGGSADDPVEHDDIAEHDPEAAADLAAQDEPAQQDESEDWKQARKVPFKAFDAERRRAREAEAKAAQQQEYIARATERLNMLMAAMQPEQQQVAPPQVEAPPDPEQDIFAYTKWQAQQIEAVKRQNQALAEAQARDAQTRQIATHVTSLEAQFAAQVPDYVDAVAFAKEARVKMYAAAGLSPQAAQQRVQQEIWQFVHEQTYAGRNPAQSAYEMAKALGYTPRAKGGEQPRNENGQFVAPRSDKLDTVAKAQARNTSLSSASGSAGNKGLSLEALANMPDRDFEAVLARDSKNGNEALKRALGYR